MPLFDLILPVSIFAVSAIGTPGPNNVMLTASGVNFGFRRSLPHMMGITVGFAAMNLAIGLGLGQAFEQVPSLHVGLKYISIAYLLYLAWKIATAGAVNAGKAAAKPFTFLQAAAFQWVNPKAWAIAVSAVATFATVGGNLMAEVVLMSLVFLCLAVFTTSSWAFFGAVIGRYLHSPRRLNVFNGFMAGLLLLSLVPAIS